MCAGVAIWCSLGTIGLVGAASTSVRVALLASWWLLPLSMAAVFAAIRIFRLSPREQSPLFGSAVLILPWLPFQLPPAALLWTGPFAVAVWAAVIAGIVAARLGDGRDHWMIDRHRAPIVAAMLALVLYGASAVWLSPILPDGDEPHYLILAQSLIKDGDFRIENNHRHGDYLEYSLTAAAPDYLRRGINGDIYSIHAPGLAALIAPAMWLFGYPGVVGFLAFIAAVSTALVWHVAYRTTGSAGVCVVWMGVLCADNAVFLSGDGSVPGRHRCDVSAARNDALVGRPEGASPGAMPGPPTHGFGSCPACRSRSSHGCRRGSRCSRLPRRCVCVFACEAGVSFSRSLWSRLSVRRCGLDFSSPCTAHRIQRRPTGPTRRPAR